MAQLKSAEVSEAEIAVHWQEEAHMQPLKKFVAQANLGSEVRNCCRVREGGMLLERRRSCHGALSQARNGREHDQGC